MESNGGYIKEGVYRQRLQGSEMDKSNEEEMKKGKTKKEIHGERREESKERRKKCKVRDYRNLQWSEVKRSQ